LRPTAPKADGVERPDQVTFNSSGTIHNKARLWFVIDVGGGHKISQPFPIVEKILE
jgi:hypothetical protein